MGFQIADQLRPFLLAVLLGLGAGLWYDLLRAVRLRLPRLTGAADLLYCLTAGTALFLFVLRQAEGQLRGFVLLGAGGGCILFFTLFSDSGPINSLLMQIGFIDTPYKFLSNAGSTRGLVAFMNCLMWFGNTTILLMAGMMGIDTSLFEAAEVDGATSMQVFFKITLPLLRPILVYVLITSLIGGLQLFDVPQILTNGTGDPMRSSMTLIMFLNKHLYSKNYGMAGALSVVLFFITGVLSLVVFKITGNDKRKG